MYMYFQKQEEVVSSFLPFFIALCFSLSPLCRIYALLDRVGTGSDIGLSPIRRQAII